MKKVLITGGNGNLGFLVAERLAAQGVDIVRFDIPASGREGPGAEVLGDIRDHALLASVMEDHQPDAIIHLASLLSGSSEEDLDVSWEINATGSFRLLRLAQDHGLTGPFLFASTVATYGDAWVWQRTADQTWADAFTQPPQPIALGPRGQSEAIAYATNGQTLYFTAEKPNQPFWKIDPLGNQP